MAPQRSRGCLRCRQRRVKCDQGRPSCQRCLTRNELCAGYREEADLIFQHETEFVVHRHGHVSMSSPSRSPLSVTSRTSRRSRSQSFSSPSSLGTSHFSTGTGISSHGSPRANSRLDTEKTMALTSKEAVSGFLDKYVLYPCNETSSPGFLEHLPCLFKGVNVDGRYALRWAVQAAGFADASRQEDVTSTRQASDALVAQALDCYGRALTALAESLSERGKAPDDYDLMTMVTLDIFETLFISEDAEPGAHAQAMAHILRLRGHAQFHDPRGWGLFRLAHHRLQKQQLAKNLDLLPESLDLLSLHDTNNGFGHVEHDVSKITNVCRQANSILSDLNASQNSHVRLLSLVSEMHRLDLETTKWRDGPAWTFRTLFKSELSNPEALSSSYLPDKVEIHRDLWMLYEWNYHRAARIIMHQKLVRCLDAAAESEHLSKSGADEVETKRVVSIIIIQNLAEDVLATVPQSFGDVDHAGRCHEQPSQPHSRAIGAYFLLWPIKIIKGPESKATESQQKDAQRVFERIRETTGMKRSLGSLSII